MARWDLYALCPQGHVVDRVPFGDMFHVHTRVCPECAAPKSQFEMVTGRWVRDGWFDRRFERLSTGAGEGED